MAKRKFYGKRAVVTGASSGIGREIARQLAQSGAQVVAVARRAERLQELVESAKDAPGCIVACPADVTDAQAQDRILQAASHELGGLDILVNNAGIAALGLFEKTEPAVLRQVMELNFFSLVELSYKALPLLKVGDSPILVNVSSVLGYRGITYRSYYCASKFAVQGFSEAIRAELRKYGIDVLVASPGRTKTELFDSPLEKGVEPPWPEPDPMPPEKVAAAILRATRKGKPEVIPHLWGKGMVFLSRVFPRLMDRILARYS